jgi:excisionase family DNA binding protein
MENVQMLLPIEPAKFWSQLKTIVEEVMEQKNAESSPSQFGQKYSNQPLLKVSEVCKIFKVSKPTIYDWLRQGKLKSIKIESRRYFRWKDIEELIKKSPAF